MNGGEITTMTKRIHKGGNITKNNKRKELMEDHHRNSPEVIWL